ncbi:MAG: prepilin-type N-terminal cleavage/methylation domain-containing protein [Deltaproteobacteria bacterium]|nr:prepilin-type N-terminal cleavage/methylation domain-containing protein [Deltaproteobacteria bacterium]
MDTSRKMKGLPTRVTRKWMNQNRLANTKGFTLLEILVAVTILSIALLGMAGLTAALMEGTGVSNRLTTATTLVQDKLEEMTDQGYAFTPATDTTTTENYNTIAGHPWYKRVTEVDVDNPGTMMKTVTVTVFWHSDSHSVASETILTR